MKKMLAGTMAVCLLAMPACAKAAPGGVEPAYPTAVSEDDYDARSKLIEDNELDSGFYETLNQFAIRSGALALGSGGNEAYSPLSLYLALAVASEGAGGQNKEQFSQVLGVAGKDESYLKEQCSRLLNQLYGIQYPYFQCSVSNSLWIGKDTQWNSGFLNTAVSDYYASLYQVDFADPMTGKQMGAWVKERTKGVIEPQMDVSKQLMSILNTVYFKAEWMDKFEKESIEDGIFHTSDNQEVDCKFLTRTRNPYGYLLGDGFMRSSLGFKDNANIVFVLPDEGKSIVDMAADQQLLEDMLMLPDSGTAKVNFKIPKFSFGSDLELTQVLEQMGLTDAFTEAADFTPMTEEPVWISSVRQQSHMSLDEKGVEAASFTNIAYSGAAMPQPEVVDMILDRPFLYGIYCQDVLVFVGICQNPGE